jgi:lipopolysaccharide assembly outer membrane protein LptD (OstA)
MTQVSGTVNRTTNNTTVTDNIVADAGQYNRAAKTITLDGNVRIDSSNGDKIRTKELVIKL